MLGVCYYPEHWPQSWWKDDAIKMRSLGLEYVRIGEFSWSRLEPSPGEFQWQWLDDAIETLANAGLKVILGTPTATPPKWLIKQFPHILATDPETGAVRGFGSRRHYDFSSDTYLQESLRISEAMAKRYGTHPAVVGWQTDNELCCHDTTLSASPQALKKFRHWCETRYGSIENLNSAWGNVFWSMEYQSFADIELPFFAVTETNPAHQLAYRRFSSDQVVVWHNEMIEVIRRHCGSQFVTHNFIPPQETNADNFALAEQLDFACYDNYPLGRTDLFFANKSAEEFAPYMRTGHPDFGAFYQDQTRGLSQYGDRQSNYWIMEQQPGPVNWAKHNPRPAPGMVRFWTLEAFAHGADTVCYFRWRQAPFAQEQMHAGVLRPDNSKATAWHEIEQVVKDLQNFDVRNETTHVSKVAIITETQAQWVDQIERQGEGYEYIAVQMEYYSALRQLGLDVDFVSQDHDLSKYQLILAPSLPIVSESFVHQCKSLNATIVFGPRSGAKTLEFRNPNNLAPGLVQELIPVKVLSVETLRSDCPGELHWKQKKFQSGIWREELLIDEDSEIVARYEDQSPAILARGNCIYIGTLTDEQFLKAFFKDLCSSLQIQTLDLANDVRIRRRGDLVFCFNYSQQSQLLPMPEGAQLLLGDKDLPPLEVAVWRGPKRDHQV